MRYEQLSENMARKYFSLGCGPINWTRKKEDLFVYNLRAVGLIKPSKLDKAREWCRKVRLNDTLETAYREAVEDTEGYFEDAISEIMEERNA